MSARTDHTPDPTTHGLMFVLFDPNDADRESWREDFGGDAAQAWEAFAAKYPPESGVRVVRTESGPVRPLVIFGP
jgi:hypothetical protein